jgi:hypothetical protein
MANISKCAYPLPNEHIYYQNEDFLIKMIISILSHTDEKITNAYLAMSYINTSSLAQNRVIFTDGKSTK